MYAYRLVSGVSLRKGVDMFLALDKGGYTNDNVIKTTDYPGLNHNGNFLLYVSSEMSRYLAMVVSAMDTESLHMRLQKEAIPGKLVARYGINPIEYTALHSIAGRLPLQYLQHGSIGSWRAAMETLVYTIPLFLIAFGELDLELDSSELFKILDYLDTETRENIIGSIWNCIIDITVAEYAITKGGDVDGNSASN